MKNKKNKIYPIVILIATLFMGIGYASVNSVLLDIKGTAEANLQNTIYIADISYESSVAANYVESKIISAYKTMLKSSIILSDSEPNSSITYEITMRNETSADYIFYGEEHLDSEDTYSNNEIVFEIDGLAYGDILASNTSVTFKITFHYKDNVLSDNNILNSILNFRFEYITSPKLTSNMVPVYFENGDWKKADINSTDWFNYSDRMWANAITIDSNLVYNNVINDTELKKFNGTSDYYSLGNENINFANGFSIVIRFKLDKLSSTEYFVFGNAERAGFGLTKNPSNKLVFSIYNENKGSYLHTNANLTLEANVWYTVVATYDGNISKLYINGALNSSATINCDYVISRAPIMIGANPGSTASKPVNGSYFSGTISEAIVFSKVLNENYITQYYNKEINHNYNASGVVNYVKFPGDNAHLQNGAYYSDEGIVFDGENDYIPIGFSGYNFNKNITVGARFKLEEIKSSNKTIVGNVYGNTGFQIAINTNNQVIFVLRNSTSTPYVHSTFELSEGVWYTVVATYDGNTIKLYINGTLNNTTNATGKITQSSASIGIGGRINPSDINSTYYMNGVISDIMILGETLSASQIKEYYSENLTSIVSDNTLISYNLRSFESKSVGSIIPSELISTMWVWVPRYVVDTPKENNELTNIKFVPLDEEAHDAFTFNNQELSGFWIGKFETSSETPSLIETTKVQNIQIIPNSYAMRNSNLATLYNSIKNMTSSNNVYGFSSSRSELDIHGAKNNEWAATAFLASSLYGISKDNYNQVEENTHINNTGGANYLNNVNQSTTGNVYGVYDMNGGLDEYVMGNYMQTLGSSGFSSTLDKIYYNNYTTEADYMFDKLQHGVFDTNGLYNSLSSDFVSATKPWLVRNNLFSFYSATGASDSNLGIRAVLVVK